MGSTCDLDLEEKNKQILCTTLRLMMVHHYTKFGHKRWSGSEHIDRTNIH